MLQSQGKRLRLPCAIYILLNITGAKQKQFTDRTSSIGTPQDNVRIFKETNKRLSYTKRRKSSYKRLECSSQVIDFFVAFASPIRIDCSVLCSHQSYPGRLFCTVYIFLTYSFVQAILILIQVSLILIQVILILIQVILFLIRILYDFHIVLIRTGSFVIFGAFCF